MIRLDSLSSCLDIAAIQLHPITQSKDGSWNGLTVAYLCLDGRGVAHFGSKVVMDLQDSGSGTKGIPVS